MTMRWTRFVPSQICLLYAMQRADLGEHTLYGRSPSIYP